MLSNVIKSYRQAWKNVLFNWRLVLLLYAILLGLSFVALGPFLNLIDNVLGSRMMLKDFTSGFDYTSISDMLLHHGVAVNLSLSVILSFFIIYFLWSAFYSGGIMEVARHRNIRSSRLIFWKGSAEYFFRFLRLSIYVSLAYIILFGLSYYFLASKGFNPLQMETENDFIIRVKITAVVILVVGFFLSIFRDIARAIIVQKPNSFFLTFTNLKALGITFFPKFIFLSLLNLFFLGLGMALYLLLKKLLGNPVWIGLLLGQLFLAYRIFYRIVRLASFKYLVEETIAVPLDHNQSDSDIL